MSHPNRTRQRWRSAFLAMVTVAAASVVTVTGATSASAATIDTNAWYQLVSRHSGKAVDVCNVSTADRACIQQWDRNNQGNQQFQFVSSGDGYYRLKARHSGKVIDVLDWSTANGATLIQWPDHGGVNQQWRVVDTDSGYVKFINRHSGKAMDVWEWSTANGGRISQYTDTGSRNQHWQLIKIGGSSPPADGLPSSFQWRSSGPLIGPKSDATHSIRAVKDPSVVYHNGRYHVFASTTNNNGGYSMVYLNFTDWSQAGAAQHHYLDQTAIGGGYQAAPHVFYFAPHQRWYLVFQTGDNAAYSTTTDISNPQSWTAPQRFYPNGMPQIIRDNIGRGYWVDFWVICDSAKCYLFSSDDNGHLYRSETTVANFPSGMTNTVIAMQDANPARLFEAANVYKVEGSDTYLLIHEAIGSDGKRYFRSWTAPAITGPWSALADTEANPFARANNVTFDGTAWTRDISHGEMIRSGTDQTMTISPCKMRYVYQGVDPGASDSYNFLPWRLGLLTQTNSTC